MAQTQILMTLIEIDPDPSGGDYSTPPDSLFGFKGFTLWQEEGGGREGGEEKGRRGARR